ncbi:MAG: hypothetical protein JO320_05095 [Alphaproteobacteria bacterium]|nr:hypothetical protein [Alphaproteobacteria bacterium]
MKLNIVSRGGYPARDSSHRLIAKVGRLQCFDEKSGTRPELSQAVQQKSEALFFSTDRPQHDRLRHRP